MPECCCGEKRRVKEYFREKASQWDSMRSEYFDEEVREAVVEKAAIKLGDTVLDLGCGTGFLTLGAAKALGEGGRVVGVDFSEEMIDEAKKNIASAGLIHKVEFRLGEAEDVPVGDSSVDAVIGNMVLHHSTSPKRVFEEGFRVLKAGGRFVLSDLEEHDNEWLRTEMADVWLGFNLEDVKNWMEESGFRDVEVELTRTKCCGVSIGGRKAEIGIFLAKGIKP